MGEGGDKTGIISFRQKVSKASAEVQRLVEELISERTEPIVRSSLGQVDSDAFLRTFGNVASRFNLVDDPGAARIVLLEVDLAERAICNLVVTLSDKKAFLTTSFGEIQIAVSPNATPEEIVKEIYERIGVSGDSLGWSFADGAQLAGFAITKD